MHFSRLVASAAALSMASAGVIRRSSTYESAVYWVRNQCTTEKAKRADDLQGQEPDGDERSLGDYCAASEGIDILIISFLDKFGNRVYPNGYLGDCAISSGGSASDCGSLESDIETCQAAGKKVFLSIGGAGAKFDLNSPEDAAGVADSLWNSYANPAVTSGAPRPLGNITIDGWDLDIEGNPDNSDQYLADLVNALRAYFPNDSSHTYYISGAPQCPLNPIPDMDSAIMNSQFDYLFIQFYNNNCAAAEYTDPSGSNPDGDGQFNFADWPGYLAGGKSSGAKLHIGFPASTKAADVPFFYVPTYDLPELINNHTSVPGFNGVMLWDAGNSDIPNVNGCNYAQEVRKVLDTGSAC